MRFLTLLEAKRDGHAITAAEMRALVAALTAGRIPDYQLAAFLMAVYFQGLDPEETAALTLAMRDSGDRLDFPADPRPRVDKHSTGGVGDKVSLPLVPLLACLGFRVPMISGRGLGITGGTLDKLESIPGFITALPADRVVELVQTVGGVICGQTARMAPADQKLYALRDVTGTVPSIPLIVASILSKKLAEGVDALLLDVKFGAAAFMPSIDRARQLARAMVDLGSRCGVNTRAILTEMSTPLGCAAGNWLEVKESVACLEGRGPDDLRELVVTCAAHLLVQTRFAGSLDEARARAAACLTSGRPRAKWNEILAAQGADLEACERKLARDHTAPVLRQLSATRSGWVNRCDARLIGEVIRDLGGGRWTKESAIDPDVGVDGLVKPGEWVEQAAPLARIHASDRASADTACARLAAAFELSVEPVSTPDRAIESLIADHPTA